MMPEPMQLISGIKIRWITTDCFEIVLPNGKVILSDPYITDSPNKSFSPSEVSGADYILTTHIHFDHVNDLKEIAGKFNSLVFVGDLSATELCRLHDLAAERIFRMRGGEKIQFDDCVIEAISGRHILLPPNGTHTGLNSTVEKVNSMMKRPQDEEWSIWLGCIEQLSYLVTTRDGTSILFWGGQATEDQCNKLRGIKPTVAIIQASGILPEKVAKVAGAIGAQIAIPHHHDYLKLAAAAGMQLVGRQDADALIKQIGDYMAVDAPYTKFIELERGEWYAIGTAIGKMA